MKRFNPKPCPEPGDGVHNWYMHAAHCAVKAGMTDEQAVEEIWRLATREPRWNEIEEALAAARGERRSSTPRWSPPNAALIEQKAKGGPALIELVGASPQPISFGQRSRTEEMLDALYPADSLLCLGKSPQSAFTAPRQVWRGFSSDQSLIVPSPMTADRGRNKQGRLSRRCEANTGSRRFLIVEFDRASLDRQAALLWHLTDYAFLTLVVFSGSRSLHGWFFCEGQPEDRIRGFFDYAVALGADPAMWTRCQVCRVPDGKRYDGKTEEGLAAAGVTGVQAGRQAVLYFSPGILRGLSEEGTRL